MREQEVRELYEAYLQVHQVQEEVEQLNEEAPERITKRTKNPRLMKDAGPARVYNPVKEEIDLFDTILEYLVAEGYADTNESALVIMANMSEGWKQSIIEQQVPIHPAEDAFNKSTPEDRAANMKKYNTPYKPLDTSRSNGTGGAPAWMRGGFKSPDEYNKLDPKTKAMLD